MTALKCAALAPLIGLCLLAGCGPSRPAEADAEKSKEVLRATLDAWKQGDKPEALKARWPAIHANDPDWSSGALLDRYEIQDGAGKPNGYDFSCPVTLWLRGGGGAVKSKTVHYTIGTGASLVVVRESGA